jgi:hypothetical protein
MESTPRYSWAPRSERTFLCTLAVAVWAIFAILMAVAPHASAQGSVGGSSSVSESKPLRLYGLHGSFNFSQENTNVSLATAASGSPTRNLESARYVIVIKRKPLGKSKRWRIYFRSDTTQPFMQYRGSVITVTRSNSWSLPLESRTYRYKMSVKLVITTASGAHRMKQFKPGMLPVEKFRPITS